jgi:cysteine-rich repeat protein
VPQFENVACGLYCRTTPYQAIWREETYALDFTVDAVIECNSTCGDGLRAGREECDDGNTESGDGCSSNCVFEDVVRYSVPANATWECAMISANTTSSGNQLRGAVTCYRDLCQRSQLFKDIQSAKAISQALTAVVSTVIPFALFRECNLFMLS